MDKPRIKRVSKLKWECSSLTEDGTEIVGGGRGLRKGIEYCYADWEYKLREYHMREQNKIADRVRKLNQRITDMKNRIRKREDLERLERDMKKREDEEKRWRDSDEGKRVIAEFSQRMKERGVKWEGSL